MEEDWEIMGIIGWYGTAVPQLFDSSYQADKEQLPHPHQLSRRFPSLLPSEQKESQIFSDLKYFH
jgi:hypothetical protein